MKVWNGEAMLCAQIYTYVTWILVNLKAKVKTVHWSPHGECVDEMF